LELANVEKWVPLKKKSWRLIAIGSLGTIVLHGSLLAPILVLGEAAKPINEPEGSRTGRTLRAEEFSTTLIFISPSSLSAETGYEWEQATQSRLNNDKASLAFIEPPPTLDESMFDMDAVENASAEVQQQDAAGLAALFGRYTGQVRARIERGWAPPQQATPEFPFNCQARIEQDRFGNVLSIELVDCDQDSSWQLSLVAAIERASPLSPPPTPSVFSTHLLLSFSSRAILAHEALAKTASP
jgi:hypothetical protein